MAHIRFAEILKDYLDDNNISNKEFSARIGVTQKHLIDILSGEANLSTSVIQAISIVTDIPIDYIVKIEENYRMEQEIDKYLKDNNMTVTQYLNRFSYKVLKDNNWINFVYFLFHNNPPKI